MVGIARCHTAGRSGSVGKSFRPALAAGQGHGSWRYLADNRLFLEAVFWRVRTGTPWRIYRMPNKRACLSSGNTAR